MIRLFKIYLTLAFLLVTPLSLHKRSEYMKSELITRIQLKNDTEANWLTFPQ